MLVQVGSPFASGTTVPFLHSPSCWKHTSKIWVETDMITSYIGSIAQIFAERLGFWRTVKGECTFSVRIIFVRSTYLIGCFFFLILTYLQGTHLSELLMQGMMDPVWFSVTLQPASRVSLCIQMVFWRPQASQGIFFYQQNDSSLNIYTQCIQSNLNHLNFSLWCLDWMSADPFDQLYMSKNTVSLTCWQ